MNLDFFAQTSFSCPSCQHDMVKSTGVLRFDDDQIEIVIDNVPMLRCPSCGYELIPGPVAEEISVLVNNVAKDMRGAPVVNGEFRADYLGTAPDVPENAFAIAD